jgi:TRZ/ATZ family hydrolase, putative
LKLHIHVAETQEENKIILERYGKRPLAFLKDLGYLDRPAIFAHGVELNSSEIADLAVSPVSIAHNPISNLKLASGVAPVTDLLAAGVTVGLATDSVASNNNLDMFEEGRTAALLQKMRAGDATQFTIEQALKTLTIEGAKALGLEKKIGSLETGKQADFIVIQPKGRLHLYPLENMLSHLVYAVKGSDVQDVYIAGRQVVQDGQVLTVDLGSFI